MVASAPAPGVPAARLGAPARHLGAVGSTMTEAAAWAAEGAPHGALVTARHQSAGRGRHGRAWAAGPGEGLLFTVVLRPSLGPDRLGLVPVAAGLAVAEAVEAWGVRASLKWPNDVRVGGRKLAGVLAEASHGPAGPVVLLGVGLNVRQRAFPPGLAATSLAAETGRDADPLGVLPGVLRRLEARLADVAAEPGAVVRDAEARLERGAVGVRDPGSGRTVAAGRVLGLAPDGALRLATDGGERTVHAGEVTLAPAR